MHGYGVFHGVFLTTGNQEETFHASNMQAFRRHFRSLTALASVAAAVMLSACSTPANVRDDAQFQSYASVADRPIARPHRQAGIGAHRPRPHQLQAVG